MELKVFFVVFLLGRSVADYDSSPVSNYTVHDKMGNWTFFEALKTSHITMHISVRPKRWTCKPVGQGRATIALHSVGPISHKNRPVTKSAELNQPSSCTLGIDLLLFWRHNRSGKFQAMIHSAGPTGSSHSLNCGNVVFYWSTPTFSAVHHLISRRWINSSWIN